MQKIESVFVRDWSLDVPATREVTEGCEWVMDGQGVATIKFDGTCCLVRNGLLYRRHRAKEGKVPPGWFHWNFAEPAASGHGWVGLTNSNADRWHREALEDRGAPKDGTYELVGPAIQKNPYGLEGHELWRHGEDCRVVERSYEAIRAFLEETPHEGLVFHRADGAMAKVKRTDFRIPWPIKARV